MGPGDAGPTGEDEHWMHRALALADRGRRTVSPNPLVGCVVVAGGTAVGEGWHERAGGPHAEVVALAAAGDRARGATAYVTLEPCAHTGRTGPCTAALLAAGVARVVAAMADPDPVAAGGAERLRAAGVAVDVGVLGDHAARQNRVFLTTVREHRPHVVLKAAVSLDGRIAAADGTSRWLTGVEARRVAHRLRAEAGTVLVGSGTVLADDPQLTVRWGEGRWSGLDEEGVARQPLRVVLDARGRVPRSARVRDDAAPTLVIGGPAGADAPDAVALDDPHDLRAVLGLLWDREVRSVLVEGGAEVAGAFVRAGLVDELAVHVAPLLLGERGRPLLAGDGIGTLATAPRFTTLAVDRAGDDTIIRLTPTPARS